MPKPNSYVSMRYGSNNILTRIIDAAKANGLKEFTPEKIAGLLSEGGETPENSIRACITSKERNYDGLGANDAYFERVRMGVYRLIR